MRKSGAGRRRVHDLDQWKKEAKQALRSYEVGNFEPLKNIVVSSVLYLADPHMQFKFRDVV